ncbi:MAG: cytochrome c biogenesis protein CcsA [Flavobacteriales bacterium]
MAKHWWKVLAAILVIYASVFSFFRPLEPGLIETDKGQLSVGENTFIVTGYNTHFTEFESSLQGFLRLDSVNTVCLEVNRIIDNAHAEFKVNVPPTTLDPVADLFISNERSGSVFLPKAFLLKGVTLDSFVVLKSDCPKEFVTGMEVAYEFPFQLRIYDTIRNLNFHVPMWFTMFALMGLSLVYSIMYLNNGKIENDLRAAASAKIALVFCALGLITGSIWARAAWGDWWTNDAKLNGAAVSFLLLAAYFILRKSAEDKPNKAKISAVYNILSFFMIMSLIMILPRLTGANSLHPGEDGNPAFSSYDLDSHLRMVFYPACAGWIMTGIWIYQLRYRIEQLKRSNR